jgi:hypothetical protein
MAIDETVSFRVQMYKKNQQKRPDTFDNMEVQSLHSNTHTHTHTHIHTSYLLSMTRTTAPLLVPATTGRLLPEGGFGPRPLLAFLVDMMIRL